MPGQGQRVQAPSISDAAHMQWTHEVRSQPAELRRPRLTRHILLVLGLMNVVDGVNVNILTPYVRDLMAMLLQRDPGDPSLAFPMASLIGVYSICEFLFSFMWGALADRVGRRLALLMGIAGSVVSPIFMGTAKTMSQAFFARALDGFFCGNIAVSKAYLGELVHPGNEAESFCFLALTFSCGLFLGPLFGGQLVWPAEWAPEIFDDTIFDTYPFLLANVSYASLALVGFILGLISLEETLPPEKRQSVWPACCCRRRRQAREALLSAGTSNQQAAASSSSSRGSSSQNPLAPPLLDGENRDAEAVQPEQSQQQQQQQQPSQTVPQEEQLPSFWSSRPLLWSNVTYCCLSAYIAAWTQLFVDLATAKLNHKGFELAASEIGALQLFGYAGLMVTQLLTYPWFCKRFGYFRAFQLGVLANLSVTLLFPVYTWWADPKRYGLWRYVPLAVFQAVGESGAGFMFPTVYVWINRSAPGPLRGQANGFVNTTGAFTRAVWPLLCGVILQGLSSEQLSVWCRFAILPINGVMMIACLAVISWIPPSYSGFACDARAQLELEEPEAGKSQTSPPLSENRGGEGQVEGQQVLS